MSAPARIIDEWARTTALPHAHDERGGTDDGDLLYSEQMICAFLRAVGLFLLIGGLGALVISIGAMAYGRVPDGEHSFVKMMVGGAAAVLIGIALGRYAERIWVDVSPGGFEVGPAKRETSEPSGDLPTQG
ncbi:MAG TPA: hypothetical protein VH475_10425 [Tepidisphaeraceae bacterium]